MDLRGIYILYVIVGYTEEIFMCYISTIGERVEDHVVINCTVQI
jgi:hypothetical protein